MSPKQSELVEIYLKVKETVIYQGFAEEIDWQDNIQFSDISESNFLREAAWVILSSGMRETVIRKKFPAISTAFLFWRSAHQIVKHLEPCRLHALSVFRHEQKINAIISIAKQIADDGFEKIKVRIQNGGIKYIQQMPFMGPATSYHLAKNIGLDFVKPDRHLLRIAKAAGYNSPKLLCEDIANSVGDRISVVDLVIWRFATLNPDYIKDFAS